MVIRGFCCSKLPGIGSALFLSFCIFEGGSYRVEFRWFLGLIDWKDCLFSFDLPAQNHKAFIIW